MQSIISKYGKRHVVKLSGILNYENDKVYCMEEERYDAKVFLNSYIKHLKYTQRVKLSLYQIMHVYTMLSF